METVKLKTCTKCKTEYPATGEYFARNKTNKDGFNLWCKKCYKAYKKANRQKIAEYKKAYQKANRQKIAEYNKAYKKANREHISEYYKAWYEENREHISEYYKAWYEENREHISEYRKAYMKAYLQTPRGKYVAYKSGVKNNLKKIIGCEPPDVLVETKIIHLKTKKLCRTLSN